MAEWLGMKLGIVFCLLAAIASAQSAIRILDWNIDRGKHLPAVTAALRRERPDIVLLQEVDRGTKRSGSIDIAAELARQLGMSYTFEPAFRELGQGGDAVQGQAMLARGRMEGVRVIRYDQQSHFWEPRAFLPNWGVMQRRTGGRIALVAELKRGGRKLVVYNLHLESRGLGHTRDVQLEETIRDTGRYPAGTPIIIGGDLNTLYGTKGVRERLEESGFRNCFGDRTVRTHVIFGALDYIFVKGPLNCTEAVVLRGLNGSDHDPVAARITIDANPRNATHGAP